MNINISMIDVIRLLQQHIDHGHFLMAKRTALLIAEECSKHLSEEEKELERNT